MLKGTLMVPERPERAAAPALPAESVLTPAELFVGLSDEATEDLETLRQHPVREWTPPRLTPRPAQTPEEEREPAYYD
jgi:hypothetical protein